jgi:membrane protease YdiL (CAAX protease family)
MFARFVARRPQALWLVLVLGLAYPYIVAIGLWAGLFPPNNAPSPLRTGATIIIELALLALLDSVLRHQGRGWRDLGLRLGWEDVLHSLGLFVGSSLAFAVCAAIAAQLALSLTGRTDLLQPANVGFLRGGNLAMLLIFACVNPFVEELVLRAYPMTEWRASRMSEGRMILFSVLLQTGYHIYQGIPSMLLLSSTFFLFALYYARTGRALPIVLAHLFLDLAAVLAYQ